MQTLLGALLDSWDRNNTILLNFLHARPDSALELKPTPDSPSISQLFTHMHYVRLVLVSEDVPECGVAIPEKEWLPEMDRTRIAVMLAESARVVREAVKRRVELEREMEVHYDHPILLLQHLIWHEGYHHGQMKLTLKLAGHAMSDDQAGPLTWRVWIDKSGEALSSSPARLRSRLGNGE